MVHLGYCYFKEIEFVHNKTFPEKERRMRMLKLSASYSKKVPAEGDYTSQSYHVSLDVELPDGMTNEQIQCKIAETFALARASVEAELHPANAVKPSFNPHSSQPQQPNYGNWNGQSAPTASEEEPTASNKQVSYLNTLCKQQKVDIKMLLSRFNLVNPFHLTKRQATMLIEELKVA